MSAATRTQVAVVGGGIIGLAVAWRAAQRGLDVTVLERDRAGAGAAHVAAGMLAPVAEVEFGAAGRTLLELGSASAGLWPAFAAELGEASGERVALGGSETLFVARDADEAAELERQLDFRRSLGLPVRRLRASEARDREPALAPTIRMALALGGERTVDPRRVLDALRRACQRAGVAVREGVTVGGVELDAAGDRVAGVRLGDGGRVGAAQVVLAAGAHTPQVALLAGSGAPDTGPALVRPVKGQILYLRDPGGPGLLGGVVRFLGGYLVPRGDGRYALGATVEDRGFDPAPTAGAVHQLLCDARELVPGIDELALEELCVGFRPGTPDNLPLLGAGAVDGLVWASGHYRNGVLLTPLTAELLADLLTTASAGEQLPDPAARARMLAACSPRRFAVRASRTQPQRARPDAAPPDDPRGASTSSSRPRARAGART
jgi:glycine oxidase